MIIIEADPLSLQNFNHTAVPYLTPHSSNMTSYMPGRFLYFSE